MIPASATIPTIASAAASRAASFAVLTKIAFISTYSKRQIVEEVTLEVSFDAKSALIGEVCSNNNKKVL